MKHLLAGLAVCFMVVLTGCSGVPLGLSSSTQTQVTTYAEATAAADLATRTLDVAVTSGVKYDKATLTELGNLNDSVHSAWLTIKAANDKGESLTFAAFNAALAAYQSYRASQGIPEAPPAPTS